MDAFISIAMRHPEILPLSYSKGNILLKCPLQFKLRYLEKSEGGEALEPEVARVGKFIHKVLEYCTNRGQSYGFTEEQIDFDHTWMQVLSQFGLTQKEYDMASALRIHAERVWGRMLSAIQKYAFTEIKPESCFALSKSGRVVGATRYADKVYSGVIDFLGLTDTRALLVDYKTHSHSDKKEAVEYLQLLSYAYFIFHKYPHINSVQIAIGYIPDEDIKMFPVLSRDALPEIEKEVIGWLSSVVEEFGKGTFLPSTSDYCKWCNYVGLFGCKKKRKK